MKILRGQRFFPILLRNVEVSYKNVKLQLAMPEIRQAGTYLAILADIF